ncbi:SigB/SigF/SigG family RNA polymerase sigma factor [Actinacidiphila paucisporea]|uniref:RNA polymerase sigma-B factor n=1 Tax=Actinacidiphila paucisporea TaxID=310782 RepID=A0A1M7LPL0_9ACTN|nr:SigB/SigF/SigG family RNA polymerase sigma factor [Actinacidiphila paucisporea]SHM79965.1 RNA polymerase sigma-B factor [Actinacidiphila paucisporea]
MRDDEGRQVPVRPGERQHDVPAESDELFQRMLAARRKSERDACRERLIIVWMPMARRLAGRYRSRGETLEDLQQVAAVGLIKAVDRFDPTRGHAFASYAVPTIDGEIKRHFRDHLWSVHVPRSVQELRNRVRTACQELDGGHAASRPSVADVVARTGLSVDEVRAGLAALDSYAALSLDAALEADSADAFLGHRIGVLDPAFDRVVDREAVKPTLRALPLRERTILFLRFFNDMKQAEIAAVLGISQMHVSRLLNNVCAQLRAVALEEHAAG